MRRNENYPYRVKRRPLLFAVPGLVALVLLLPLGSVAGAHAAYRDSDPADESQVAQAPTQIWAEYTEPPSQGSYLRVFDPCGEQVDNGDSRPEGYRLYVTLSSDRSGLYRVEWFVDSSLDNHPTRGTFTFTATEGEPCPGEEPSDDDGREGDRNREPVDREKDDVADRPVTSEGERSDDIVSAAGGDDDRRARRADTEAPKRSRARNKKKRDRHTVDPPVAEAVFNVPVADEQPGLLSDVPLGGVVIALLMTIAIGVAGGFIYAGIMGYHRTSD